MKNFYMNEEKKFNSVMNAKNKFSYFGYVGDNLEYPVFVDEVNNVNVLAQSPKEFFHCVKKLDEHCVQKEMEDMLEFTFKYEKLCKTFGFDKKVAKDYLQKSVDHIFSRYQAKTKSIETLER